MPTDNDGVIEIPISGEENRMSQTVDLPPNFAAHMQAETLGNIQATNAASRDSAQTANAVLRFAAARNFDELGVTESRAASGVFATPIASPATQSGA